LLELLMVYMEKIGIIS